MNIKEYLKINEMSLPDVKSAEEARAIILKYAPIINAGNTKGGDYLGFLEAALATIGKATNPEAYAKEVKMAKSAIMKLRAYNATVSKSSKPSLADKEGLK